MAIVFVLELGAGISIYAYRAKLSAGFDKGLNESMVNYRTESAQKIADLDAIQSTVSVFLDALTHTLDRAIISF